MCCGKPPQSKSSILTAPPKEGASMPSPSGEGGPLAVEGAHFTLHTLKGCVGQTDRRGRRSLRRCRLPFRQYINRSFAPHISTLNF